MPGTLQDKIALVTGAGSGIGRASSLALAREGAKVVVSDVNAEGAEATLSTIKDRGGDGILIDINLKGVWLCMKHEIPQMLSQGGGAIVNTASVAGLVGSQRLSAYIASKHGVVGLTKAAALEYARDGIRVNAVCPGIIETPMVRRLIAGRDDDFAANIPTRQPIGRLGTPEEIAESVAWLCSDAASLVTGLSMAVDGGITAQ